mmetsp:Transcript_6371/g.8288  ORF Transcript_6371/g.8288 Transcript_6371/m.8288 type:complete len:156 (+) Transcript_6371:126-593(+)
MPRETPNESHNQRLMYLNKDYWSPRYDSTFYSIKFQERQRLEEPPHGLPRRINGKTNHPAFYYEINVYRGQITRKILRRFSHFRWLYDQIKTTVSTAEEEEDLKNIQVPPGTCPLHFQSDDFAKAREKALEEFLKSLLDKSSFSSHAAVITFLEL